MANNMVVIDLDNTIVDTAVRKCAILNAVRNVGEQQVTIEEVRADFEMEQWIKSERDRAKVFGILNSPEGVSNHVAPLFHGVTAAIRDFRLAKIQVAILTTRPAALHDTTINELKNGGLNIEASELLTYSGASSSPEPSNEEATEFKRAQLDRLAHEHVVLGFVGDRPLDVWAAKQAGVIPILLSSTMAPEDRTRLKERVPEMQECHSWANILDAVLTANAGVPEFVKMRQAFISQYSGWLRDIDEKCRITVMIAAVLVGVSGKQLLDESHALLKIALALSLFASLLAVIYGIKAYTSRHTSGQLAGRAVIPSVKQWIGYLSGWPERWMYVEGDEVAQWKELCRSSVSVQGNAHVPFFVGRYRTLSSEAMLNLRLFELRASNYSKLYGERLASRLLIIAVLSILIWIVGTATVDRPGVNTEDAIRRELGQVTEAVQELKRRVDSVNARDTALIGAVDMQAADLAELRANVAQLESNRPTGGHNPKGKSIGKRSSQQDPASP